MPNKTVKTLTVDGVTYDIKDAKARADIAKKQDKLPDGTTGHFLKKTATGVEWAEVKSNGSGRNIGDIFYTTRKDTSLSGAVECNGGTYSTADYTGTGSIGELLKAGKLPYVSLTEYANKISTDGVCGVFGWNGGTSTSFRVPLLKDVFVEAAPLSENQHGWHIAAGLPNITGSMDIGQSGEVAGRFLNSLNPSGAIQPKHTSVATWSHSAYWGGGPSGISIDASKSSPIYGNSTTVQPEAVKYRAMVQLFNATTDEAVATVGTVVAQVGELNSHRVVDFQIPTEENGYTWYRKYADGWVEQGGYVASDGTTKDGFLVSLPIEMANTHYHKNRLYDSGRTDESGFTWAWACDSSSRFHNSDTTTQAVFSIPSTTYVWGMYWEVSGMAK